MRKVSFAIAVGFVLVACGGGEESQPPKTPVTPVATTPEPAPTAAEAPKEEPKPKETLADLQQKALKGFVEAMNAHDAKKLSGFYAENAVVKTAGVPDVTGRDNIAQSYGKLFEAFKDYTTAPGRVFMKGDVVVVEWTFNGTHTGDLWGVKATEKKVGLQGADVVWFTPEGQIKEHHVYYDPHTILSQVGASKQKARAVPAMPASPQIVSSSGAADETKNVDAVKSSNAAMEAKKEADWLATMTDSAEWDDMTQPQTTKGKADMKKWFKEMSTAFPDMKSSTANMWGVGDYVISEESHSATHKGPLFGMPATKKPVTIKMLSVMQLKDGKLVKGWSYANGVDFMQQLGMMPKPGEAKPAAGDKKPAAPAGDKKPAAPAKK